MSHFRSTDASFCAGLSSVATDYRPGQVAELLGVSVDTVRRWCDEGRLDTTRSTGGHRLVSGRDLARYLSERADAYEPDSLPAQSARNRFTGIVTRVERDTLTAVVEIQAGPHRVVSLMTREAADELALEPGDLAVAAVKSTTVLIEVPRL
ncbi:MAG: helix-turn-helix transcriptional regulator [Acidimicrobiales bacterium]|nr:helix-turn-helix transcriptional regulator [Acidimicrobiales bacterium]